MRVLMVSRAAWGTLTDAYKLANIAARRFSVRHIGLQPSASRSINADGVEIEGLAASGPRLLRLARLVARVMAVAYAGTDLVYVYYFPGCSLLRLMVWGRQVVLDVRTCCVSEGLVKRVMSDWLVRLEARCFRHIAVVSAGLAQRMRFPRRKVKVIPLGADPLDLPPKRFERWNLLYVGCFDDRRLEIFLQGFAKFRRESAGQVHLTMVGEGFNGERAALQSLARKLGVSDVVQFTGYIPHAELAEVFRNANAGISFVPITPWYDVQPCTKTFEYWAAGMPVLATATQEHRAVVTDDNGVLTVDTAEGVYEGLRRLCGQEKQWDSRLIRDAARQYSWEAIAQEHFEPYLLSLVGASGEALLSKRELSPTEAST